MSSTEFPSSWTDPEFVGAIVGVLATGALCYYSAIANTGLTVEEVVYVLLAVLIPASVAYEIARRWSLHRVR